MTINSLPFLACIIVILFFYFLFQKTPVQKYVVLLADFFFLYQLSGISGVVIGTGLVLLIYGFALGVESLVQKKEKKKAKSLMLVGVALDLFVLLYFKFFTFAWDHLKEAKGLTFDLLAPVGLAYFSLSLIGYLVDVYHKKYPAETNPIDLLSFSLFFPAIIEGPFGFYKVLSPQLKERHTFEYGRFVRGLQRILWGYFKKVVIADRIGIFVMGILRDEESAGLLLFLSMVFYSFQIYTDFSGGIDVIMGIAEIMGIELHENFKSPLVSKSVTEYWARWHMSLGEWMEKVIYYPLVLNKKIMAFSKKIPNKFFSKAFSATIASIIVFVIVGIWHGTGWNYVVYGAYQAVFVAGAILMKPVYDKMKSLFGIKEDDFGYRQFQVLRTFVILVFGRYLIKSSSLTQAIDLWKRTFTKWDFTLIYNGRLLEYGLDRRNFYLMLALILLVIIIDILNDKKIYVRDLLANSNIVCRCLVYVTVLLLIVVFGVYGKEYGATSFIYAGF